MFNLVNEYFMAFVIIGLLLFGATLLIRFTSAKTKKDKRLYNIYSAVLGVFLVLLVTTKIF